MAEAEGAQGEAVWRRIMPHLPIAVQQITSKISGLVQQKRLLSLIVSVNQEFENGLADRFWLCVLSLAVSHALARAQSSEGLTKSGASPATRAPSRAWHAGLALVGDLTSLTQGLLRRDLLRTW